MGAWRATAGNVKLLLPPRQSRGISFASLARNAGKAVGQVCGIGLKKGVTRTFLSIDIEIL
jgi:hypothetical protein